MDKLLQCKKDQKGTEAKDQLQNPKGFPKKGSENPLRVASCSEAPTSGFRSSGLAPTLARYASGPREHPKRKQHSPRGIPFINSSLTWLKNLIDILYISMYNVYII